MTRIDNLHANLGVYFTLSFIIVALNILNAALASYVFYVFF